MSAWYQNSITHCYIINHTKIYITSSTQHNYYLLSPSYISLLTGLDEVVVAHGLGPDEPLFEVAVDHTRSLYIVCRVWSIIYISIV